MILEVRAGRERRPAQVADELAPDIRRPVGTRSPRRFVLSCLEPQACLGVEVTVHGICLLASELQDWVVPTPGNRGWILFLPYLAMK